MAFTFEKITGFGRIDPEFSRLWPEARIESASGARETRFSISRRGSTAWTGSWRLDGLIDLGKYRFKEIVRYTTSDPVT